MDGTVGATEGTQDMGQTDIWTGGGGGGGV